MARARSITTAPEPEPAPEVSSIALRGVGVRGALWALVRTVQMLLVCVGSLVVATTAVPAVFAAVLHQSGATSSSSRDAVAVTVYAPSLVLCALLVWGMVVVIRRTNAWVNTRLDRWQAHLGQLSARTTR